MKITIYFKDGASYSTDKNVIRFMGKAIKDENGAKFVADNVDSNRSISIYNGYDPSLMFIYPVKELESFEIEGATQWV